MLNEALIERDCTTFSVIQMRNVLNREFKAVQLFVFTSDRILPLEVWRPSECLNLVVRINFSSI